MTIGWRAQKGTARNLIENFFRILFWIVVIVVLTSLLVLAIVLLFDLLVFAWRDYILGSSHPLQGAREALGTHVTVAATTGTTTASASLVRVTMSA